jgi:Protein O-mannosyl-transferase TMEM260-like
MNQRTIPAGRGTADVGRGTAYRPPYPAAALVTLAVFALYAITLAPTTAFWDTSEYIATAHIMGIPHPPGNPTFVVLARAWDVLLSWTGLPVAVRINLFSATMSALGHGLWFLVVARILAFYTDDRRFQLGGAAVAVTLSATAFTVWNQSAVNEKVYTVSLFTIALLTWLAFVWRDRLGQGKDDNLIVLMVFLLALSVGNHLMAFLAAPALVLFILIVEPRTFTNWKLYAAALAAIIIGLSIHVFLPLRASLHPIIDEADPSTWHALLDSLLRKQYDKPSVFVNPIDRQSPRSIALVANQIGNYIQYFDWQWARSVAGNISVFGGIRPLFTLAYGLLGLVGAWTHFKRDKISWVYMAVLFATLSLGLIFYLNFKYGYSWRLDAFPDRDMHEVRERDYFFVISFSVWGLWAGMGLAAIWKRLADDLVERAASAGRALATTAPVLAVGLIPLALNWHWASRAGDYTARDWAYNLLESVEPYGVLFTNGDNDTFPLWFAQEVEGVRKDVTVIVTSYLNTPWYVKQLRDLTRPCAPGVSATQDPTLIICQRAFDTKANPAFYTPLARLPTKSIVPLSDAEIERIANTVPFQLNQDLVFQAGHISTTLRQGTVMIPADIFMTAILTQSIGDRPIYYATTTESYDQLNLGSFLIRQGVAYQLHDGPIVADSLPGVYQLAAGPLSRIVGDYVDLPRTEDLLWHVFKHTSPGIPDHWDRWVDKSTSNIPAYYGYTLYAIYQIEQKLGHAQEAQHAAERMEAWMGLSQR